MSVGLKLQLGHMLEWACRSVNNIQRSNGVKVHITPGEERMEYVKVNERDTCRRWGRFLWWRSHRTWIEWTNIVEISSSTCYGNDITSTHASVGDFDGSIGFALGRGVGGVEVGGAVERKSHGVWIQQNSNSGQSLSSSQCCFVSQLSLALIPRKEGTIRGK